MKPNDILDTIIIPWLNKNPDELLYTQKEGLIFFISNADKITFDVWKNHKSSTFYFKNTIINDLSKSINDFGHSLIDNSSVEINKVKNRLPNILDRINKRTAMTFDKEANKLFEEEERLLIEKCDIDPISVSNENSVTVKNIKYQDNWGLFLLWVISKNNFCKCILHNSENVSIIGIKDDVIKVVEVFKSKSGEIYNIAVRDLEKRKIGFKRSNIDLEINKFDEKTFIQAIILGAIYDLNSTMKEAIKNLTGINETVINAFIKENFPRLGNVVMDVVNV